MFDVQVGPSTFADFPTIVEAMQHYESFPWWKRMLTRLSRARVTIENGEYPEAFSIPAGVCLLIWPHQSLTTTIVGGGMKVDR